MYICTYLYILKMEFKKLELEPKGNKFKRFISSNHFKKTTIYIIIGAAIGLGITYFAEGRQLSEISSKDLLTNAFTGAFIGFFLTNSPCARNRC